MRRLLGVVVVAENVVWHGLDVEAGALVRDRNPLRDLDEVVRVHVLLDELRAALRDGHREERLVLVAGKDAVKILHDHRKARVVMPLLLRQHELQRQGRLNGHLALDRTNSAHIGLSLETSRDDEAALPEQAHQQQTSAARVPVPHRTSSSAKYTHLFVA